MNLFLLFAFPLLQQPAPLPLQRYELDLAASTVGFDADSTLHAFTGTARPYAGRARAALGALAATTGGTVAVHAAELDTDSEGRDENLREDLEVERFPDIVFTLDGIDGAFAGTSAEVAARGRFLIHGVERKREFPLTLEQLPDGALHVTARVGFPMTEHGIEPHSVMGVVRVDDDLEVWIDLLFRPVAAPSATARLIQAQVSDTLAIHGGETSATTRVERFYVADGRVLRDCGARWVLGDGGLHVVDIPAATLAAPTVGNDDAFADLRGQTASLRARYDALPEAQRARVGARIREALDRSEAALLDAPVEGPAQVVVDGEWTRVQLGERVWAEFRGLEGDAPLPATLTDLAELPAAVQVALRGLSGVPREATLHGATPAGRRTLQYRFDEAVEASVPAWAWTPADWTQAAPID